MRLVAVRNVPVIDGGLDVFALLQQVTATWAHLGDKISKAFPKRISTYACSDKRLFINELRKFSCDLQSVLLDPFCHDISPFAQPASGDNVAYSDRVRTEVSDRQQTR